MPSRERKQWQHHETNKQMRQVRKQIKRNRKSKRARRRDWLPDSWVDLDTLHDLAESEPMMPRGERERRQVVMEEALATLRQAQDTDEMTAVEEDPEGTQGVVVQVSSSLCHVQVDGRILVCGLRGSLSAEDTGYTNVVAVGDQVIVSEDGADGGVVDAVLPRRSALARPDVFQPHLQQVIVANADQLLVVASWRDPPLWPELVDRYLIGAERNGLRPVICINKTDLAEDTSACRTAMAPYLDLGYPVLFTSALTSRGVDGLRDVLRGQMTVLAGMSGVGKSSLLNVVQPGLQLRTAEVSDYSHTGRHTTTQVSLLALQMGGFVVDTPGIREFGLSGLRRGELIRFYPELATLSGGCRFADCSHTHEPGCAIKTAVRRGSVSQARLHSYAAIYDELPETLSDEREQAQARTWRR